MEWRIGVAEPIQLKSRSRYGRFHSADVGKARTFRRQLEPTKRFFDLAELAAEFGYVWAPWQDRAPRRVEGRRGGVSARLDKLGFKRSANDRLTEVLERCIEDIGTVLDSGEPDDWLTTPRYSQNHSQTWPLDKGHIDVFFLDPSGGSSAAPDGYTRIVIVLDVGKVRNPTTDKKEDYNHVYEWTLVHCHAQEFTVSKPLSDFGVQKISQVTGRVFVVENNTGACGVIKTESGTTSEKYEPALTFYRYLFEATPASRKLTAEDLRYVAALNNLVEGPQFELADFGPKRELERICTTFEHVAPRRMAFKRLSPNLLDRVDAMNGSTTGSSRTQFADICRLVFTPPQFLIIGKIAASDAVTGNSDRLGGLYKIEQEKPVAQGDYIGLKNIDFDTSGRVTALDNIDPNSRLMKPDVVIDEDVTKSWDGYAWMKNKNARSNFARDIVDAFVKQTALKRGRETEAFADAGVLRDCREACLKGIALGVDAMKGIQSPYDELARIRGWGVTAREISKRIGAIG